MPYNPAVHHRRSVRLPGYDYSQPGFYFVTLVACHRECLLGEISGDHINLTPAGEMAAHEWLQLSHRFNAVDLDTWVIMPNHLHGIIVLSDARRGTGVNLQNISHQLHPRAPTTGERFGGPVAGSIPTIIRSFKSSTTQRFRRMAGNLKASLWQGNYYEHIIRNQAELNTIRLYIQDNPRRWAEDNENPDR